MTGRPRSASAIPHTERQRAYLARKAAREQARDDALRRIATEARTLAEARQIAATAMTTNQE